MEHSDTINVPLVAQGSPRLVRSDEESAAQPLLPERELLDEEARAMARRRSGMGLKQAATHGVGVCFSGGGLRAASFDCGVLWKLGELGLLKDVDHLSAVSGGGYTASAWASHIAAADGPPTAADGPEKIDSWYSLALAKLIIRMQDNIGYLVTTSHSLFMSPGKKRGGSVYGHILDVPAFAAILVGMPISNVLTFIIFWAMLLASVINLNHGHSMRAYLCSRTNDNRYTWFPNLATGGCVASFALYLCLKLVDRYCPIQRERPLHKRWLLHECTKILLSRTSLVALMYGVLVVSCMGMEQYDFGRAYEKRDIKCACARFYDWDVYDWSHERYKSFCAGVDSPPLSNHRSFAKSFLISVAALFGVTGLIAILGAPALLGLVARIVGPLIGLLGVAYIAEWRVFGPVTHQRLVWGNMAFNTKLWAALFFASCALAIADLPSQHELPRTLHRFYARSLRRAFFCDGEDVPLTALRDDYDEEQFGVEPALPGSRVGIPSSSTTLSHGQDSPLRPIGGKSATTKQPNEPQVAASTKMTAEAAVPNLILGATINEFRRPESPRVRGQMFVLTPRAWGGKHTGYARPPRWLSLSRAMALSGAAIDGFVLNAVQSKALRMALQVLNLTMGDTIRFSGALADDDDARVRVNGVLAAAVEVVEAPGGILCGRRDTELKQKYQLRHRRRIVQQSGCCPESCEDYGAGIRVGDSLATDELASTLYSRRYEILLFALVYVCFMISAALYTKSDDRAQFFHTQSPALATAGVVVMGLAVAASIYAYLPSVRFLLTSPIIQQVHLLLQITHFGTRAPPAVTLTDGGLTECIGVVELLRRRTRWIVVVDTTEDPSISLSYLRDSFDVARDNHLIVGEITDAGSPLINGSNPSEGPPSLSYEELLSPKIAEREYARLRVSYPQQFSSGKADAPAFADFGDVFVIKMRKPQPGPRKCERLIEPKDLATSMPCVQEENVPAPLLDVGIEPLDLSQHEINGLCCECAHTTCKCLPCGELPFLSVGNQFLTPFQFANLTRLASELSDAPLRKMKEELQKPTT